MLAGCGFEPLYGTRAQGNVVREFAYIHISPIKDRVGQQLRNELRWRLHATGRSQVAKYTLSTELKESTASLAVRKSAFSTRANLTMTAAYRLVDAASGERIYSASDTVTVSYNILDSEFATLMAERDARERAVRSLSEDIRIRLGVYFERPAETWETQ
ncbi:MAG: LPS assembly lipoprotein LptE [Rhodospirillaceae bacterium]